MDFKKEIEVKRAMEIFLIRNNIQSQYILRDEGGLRLLLLEVCKEGYRIGKTESNLDEEAIIERFCQEQKEDDGLFNDLLTQNL